MVKKCSTRLAMILTEQPENLWEKLYAQKWGLESCYCTGLVLSGRVQRSQALRMGYRLMVEERMVYRTLASRPVRTIKTSNSVSTHLRNMLVLFITFSIVINKHTSHTKIGYSWRVFFLQKESETAAPIEGHHIPSIPKVQIYWCPLE